MQSRRLRCAAVSERTIVHRMATCVRRRGIMVERAGLAHAGSRHTPCRGLVPTRRRHPVPSPSGREPRWQRTSGSGTPESWCGRETSLLVPRREPVRTRRAHGCHGRRREPVIARRRAHDAGPRGPWEQTDSQVLRPERKTLPGAPGAPRTPWSAPGRRTIGPAPVARGRRRSHDETGGRHTARRVSVGMTRISLPSGARPAHVHGSYSGRETKGTRGRSRRVHFRAMSRAPKTTKVRTSSQDHGGSANP